MSFDEWKRLKTFRMHTKTQTKNFCKLRCRQRERKVVISCAHEAITLRDSPLFGNF